ncbi:MAG TPA: hypothetical protein VIY26_12455 [Acidimicrobiales bacterium]
MKAMAGLVLTGVTGVTGVVVGVTVAGAVTGAAVTDVVAAFVSHPVAVPVGTHPGPFQIAVLEIEPVASLAFTVTEKVRVYEAPAATPAGMVQVMVVPLTATAQAGGPPFAQAGDPETRVVPVGTESAIVAAALVVAVPEFVATNV